MKTHQKEKPSILIIHLVLTASEAFQWGQAIRRLAAPPAQASVKTAWCLAAQRTSGHTVLLPQICFLGCKTLGMPSLQKYSVSMKRWVNLMHQRTKNHGLKISKLFSTNISANIQSDHCLDSGSLKRTWEVLNVFQVVCWLIHGFKYWDSARKCIRKTSISGHPRSISF